MTYKHGDWYCQPESKEEAREIIERAVAGGAANPKGLSGGAWFTDAYGVKNGLVKIYKPMPWSDTTKYTIEQVRELFPLPGENSKICKSCGGSGFDAENLTKSSVISGCRYCNGDLVEPAQERSGEGLLTVVQRLEKYRMGDMVEVCMNGAWHTATVHGRAGDYIIARADGYWYDEYTAENIRPIRSEREEWCEAASMGLSGGMEMLKHADYIIPQIYDAIKSGALKLPEVK